MTKKKSLLPEHLRKALPPRRQRKTEKVTVRWTKDEFELLRRLSEERNENVTEFVRSVVMGLLDQVREHHQQGS